MGRPIRHKPNDLKNVHNRMATDLLRNAQVFPIEVDDPYEPGSQITVMRSIRDPLENLHARKYIDEAQYEAGKCFQRDFEAAERGPRAIDPGKEAVDGGLMPEPITETQWRAAGKLKEVYKVLGQDGSAIIHDVLIARSTPAKVAQSRGYEGERWEKYFRMRFQECLNCLAVVYGLAMA